MSPYAAPIATPPPSPTPPIPVPTIINPYAAYHAHQLRQDPSRLNLGPLTTTTWTALAACASVFPNCETCTIAHQAQTCIGQGPSSMTDMKLCYPPRSSGAVSITGTLKGWGVYSPGIVCPAGFTSVAESTYGSNNFGFQFPLQTGETAVGCCPTAGQLAGSFTATVQNGIQTCKLILAAGAGASVGSCAASNQPSFTSKNFPFTGTGQQQIVVPSLEVLAPLVQVIWQNSDLPVGVKGPNGVAVGGSSGGSSGLSAGAQAGIGIGVALVVIALAVLAFWWRRRSQRRKREEGGSELGGGRTPMGKKNSIFSRSSPQPTQTAPIAHPEGVAEAANTEIAQLDDDTGRGGVGKANHTGSTYTTRRSEAQPVNDNPVELAA